MDFKKLIIDTLKEEVVPAMGCTEPVAVALACAKVKELIDYSELKKVHVLVSPNIYKNGLAVGIPNTNEVGLYISAALGVTGGDSTKDLRVLEGLTDEDVKKANALLDTGKVVLDIKDTSDKIYIEAVIETDAGDAKVVIRNRHNKFVYIEKNGAVILQEECCGGKSAPTENPLYDLKIRELISYIEEIPFEDIKFMLDGFEMNKKVAMAGLEERRGMGVGYSFKQNIDKGILSDDLANCAMTLTAAASDARMSGICLSVMSSNGSGNNGLTAILPIVAYSQKFEVSDEKLARALAISHIMNSYTKNYIGRLSALCACGVAAGTGAGVAIAWMMGADSHQIDGVIKNMIANTSGMICDGAKVGCALKLATSASSAVQSALLSLNDCIVPARNGIINETAEDTIKNLKTLSVEGMSLTDKVILKIMKQMQTEVK